MTLEGTLQRITKLKGVSNYHVWKTDAESLLTIQGVWDVVEVNVERPAVAATTITSAGGLTTTTPGQPSSVASEHKTNYSKAFAYLNLIIDPRIRGQYNGIRNPYLVWKKLEQLYSARDSATRDQTIRQLSEMNSTNYSSLYDYSQALKKHQMNLLNIGATLPNWLILTFFKLGLETKYEQTVSGMEQAAKAKNVDIDIDELTVALVEFDRRQ